MSDYYKVLGPTGQSIHGGTGKWFLPRGKAKGKWMDEVKNVQCCERGYHLVELYSLAEWLAADCTIYLAEGKGASHGDGSGKTAFAQARLVRQLYVSERDLRLFAADCAEHVLPIFHKVLPDDNRPALAIQAARDFAHGRIDDAARDAAWDASAAAARDASAAAARDAARAASAAAARDASWDAAWDASAAAARDAARAASWDASWAAAWDASWAAAWDAERQWQSDCLLGYMTEAP